MIERIAERHVSYTDAGHEVWEVDYSYLGYQVTCVEIRRGPLSPESCATSEVSETEDLPSRRPDGLE